MFTNGSIETPVFRPIFLFVGGSQTIDIRLQPAHAGWRLDRALAAAVPTLSRERLKALIRSGAVEATGRTRSRPGHEGPRGRRFSASLFRSRRPRTTSRRTFR